MGIVLSSCASYSQRVGDIQAHLYNNNPKEAITALEKKIPNANDLVLRDLNLAILNRQVGKFEKSNQYFEKAKTKIELLKGVSLSDQLQAMSVNEETIEYQGQHYEQLFIHGFAALNYLDLGLVDSARVEILQAQEKMKEWGTPEEGTSGYLWLLYLSGIIYEQLDEFDNALISYRQLAERMIALDMTVPEYVQKDMLRLTKKQSLDEEHKQWLETFKIEKYTPNDDNEANVIVFFFNGLAPLKRSHYLPRFSRDAGKNINIALPYYPKARHTIRTATLKLGKKSQNTIQIESVDTLARQALSDDMPAIVLRGLLRKGVKRNLVGRLDRSSSGLISLISRVASIATEHADTRSWNSLPNDIQIARFSVPAGEYTLSTHFEYFTGGSSTSRKIETFKVKDKQIKVISFHWVNYLDSRVRR